MTFITLRHIGSYTEEYPIWVHRDHIVLIYPGWQRGSFVVVSGVEEPLHVQETPEEVTALLES